MHKLPQSLLLLLLSTGFVLLLSAFHIVENKPIFIDLTSQYDIQNCDSCRSTNRGPVLDWQSGLKLKYTDFKGDSKGIKGIAIANTASGFGFSVTDKNGEIFGNIYVRFYCDESWWKSELIPEEKRDYVLAHEQLHFDICELFGRKLHRELLTLRSSGRLNERTINRLHSKLEKQYYNYQDKYDKETEHSTNRVEQYYWGKHVKAEIEAMSGYSNYRSF